MARAKKIVAVWPGYSLINAVGNGMKATTIKTDKLSIVSRLSYPLIRRTSSASRVTAIANRITEKYKALHSRFAGILQLNGGLVFYDHPSAGFFSDFRVGMRSNAIIHSKAMKIAYAVIFAVTGRMVVLTMLKLK